MRGWARGAVAVAAAAALLGPGPGSQIAAAPTTAARSGATTTVDATVRVPVAIVRPSGIAPAPDGTLYVAEDATRSVYRMAPDGTRFDLPLDLVAPQGLDLGDDGTLYVADGPRITTVAPDGTQGAVAVDGASQLGWVGVDGAGALFALDREPSRLVRIDPDGSQQVLSVTGDPVLRGLAVADDGTVTVLDVEAGEAVRRAPDGTETRIAVAGTAGGAGQSVDDDGERLLVGTADDVVRREADGTIVSVIDQALAVQVVLGPDGTAWSVATGLSGCRCPEGPGAIHRRPASGDDEIVPIGDIAALGSVAADADRSVLFTSFDGPQGYADTNPLRRSTAVDSFEDLPVDGASKVDAAADGSQVLQLARFGPASLARRSADGSITEVVLPTEPGIDVVAAFAVDQDGTIAVAMGSGYGSGAFRILSVSVDGTVAERYRSSGEPSFLAVGAGAGRIVVAVAEGSGTALLDVSGPAPAPAGALAQQATAIEVDAAGSVWAISYPATGPQLDVVRTDGSIEAVTYPGIANPVSLSAWTDGTLYVADSSVGVLSLGPIAGAARPAPPGAAPAATPVPGSPAFTG
ncbi:MAG: hypothetical protein KDB04_07135 [Acidimicrobiales bacterium]|nr:hypothetical protein [Acidimicrobiales bacterium]